MKPRSTYFLHLIAAGVLLVGAAEGSLRKPRTDQEAQACAQHLFETGMTTSRAVNRRLFLSSIAAVSAAAGVGLYRYAVFAPSLHVITTQRSPSTVVDASNFAGNIIAVAQFPRGPLASPLRAKFLGEERVRNSALLAKAPMYGLMGPEIRLPLLMTSFVGQGNVVEPLQAAIQIAAVLEGLPTEQERVQRCLEKIEQPDYFKKRYPREPAAENVKIDLKSYRAVFLGKGSTPSTEMKLQRVILDVDGEEMEVDLGADMLLPQLSLLGHYGNIARTDHNASSLLLAALVFEWAEEIRKKGDSPDLVKLLEKMEPALLPSGEGQAFEKLELLYSNARSEDFLRELKALLPTAYSRGQNITIFARGWTTEIMEVIVPLSKRIVMNPY